MLSSGDFAVPSGGTTAEPACWLAFVYASQLSLARTKAIVARWCLEGQQPLSALFDLSTTEMAARADLTPSECDTVVELRHQLAAHATWCSELAADGVQVIIRTDPSYPSGLIAALPLAAQPLVLFARGELPPPHAALATLVGEREANPLAVDTARDLAALLAGEDIVVVSGLGKGVGRAATEGALSVGNGRVLLVVPMGISVLEVDDSLARAVAQGQATLLSPFHPGAAFSEANAIARNRLIAAMADAMIVLQASEGAPVCEMADEALRLGRGVYVWEADPSDGAVVRGHQSLIEAGGLPVGEMADVLDIVESLVAVSNARRPQPAAPDAAPATAVNDRADDVGTLDPHTVLAVLSQSGRVPEALRRRLQPG